MDEKAYYDKYWDGNVQGGLLNVPPSWSSDNLRWHLSFFQKYCGPSVLDIGAGDGTFLEMIQRSVPAIKTAEALELSAIAIQKGKEKHPAVHFKQGSCDSIPYADASFDTVFAIEVVEHLLDIDRCLSEVHRILKPGGFFGVTTTDFNLPKRLIIASFFWNKFFYPNNPHIRFFTRKSLADIARQHKLYQVDYKWNRSYFGLMPHGQMAVFCKKE
jgi:ubiquinone/menaquinone biosynthesis C-methylase UbiE